MKFIDFYYDVRVESPAVYCSESSFARKIKVSSHQNGSTNREWHAEKAPKYTGLSFCSNAPPSFIVIANTRTVSNA